jgi:1,4-alpha-glucan branching enzyme
VQAAHDAGLMVFLDVSTTTSGRRETTCISTRRRFFTERHQTPWGSAIDFANEFVRSFFVHNALYWLREYRFDGLRFDAVHAIHDDSPRHILDEICEAVPDGKHLVLGNDANQSRSSAPGKYDAQWNDDSHHAYHVLATGEDDGYYVAYADAPAKHLARCLAEGFAYQGEVSPFTGEKRGEPSAHLPPSCFVDFLQNTTRSATARWAKGFWLNGERKLKTLFGDPASRAVRRRCSSWARSGAAAAVPLLLRLRRRARRAVRRAGARSSRASAGFKDRIPDPLAETTFKRCVLRWKDRDRGLARALHGMLSLEKRNFPAGVGPGRYRMLGERAFEVSWDA